MRAGGFAVRRWAWGGALFFGAFAGAFAGDGPLSAVKLDRAFPAYGSRDVIHLAVDPGSAKPGTAANVAWKVEDWEGNDVASGAVPNGAPATATLPVDIGPLPAGWYQVDVVRDGAVMARQKVVVGDAYRSRGRAFHYGVCSHIYWAKGDDFQRLMDCERELGIDMSRIEIPWEVVQRGPGLPIDFSVPDRYLPEARRNGISAEMILCFTAPWASLAPASVQGQDRDRYAPKMDDWLAYVRAVVGRYRDQIRTWEVWNEPDIGGFWKGSVAEFVELFRQSAAAIAEIQPDAEILNGGLATISRPPNPDFMPQFVAAAADRAHWTGFAYHDYMTLAQNLQRYRDLSELAGKNGLALPFWINEGGYHTLNPGGEREEAVTLVKKIAASAAQGIKAYFWYDLRDDGVNPAETEHHFGLVGNDFQPKPAYAAYRNLIAMTADRPVKESHLGNGDSLYAIAFGTREGADGETALVWSEGRKSEPIWIGGGTGRALKVSDMMGRPTGDVVPAGGGMLWLGSAPLYLEGDAPLHVVPQRILHLPERITPLEGRPMEVQVELTNPFDRETSGAVSLHVGREGSLAPVPEAWTGRLAGREKKALRLPVDAEMAGRLCAEGAVCELRFALDGAPSQSIRLPVSAPRGVGDAAHPWTVTLQGRENLRNLHEAEPTESLHWSGPSDLSIQASLSAEPGGLRIVAVVTDDVHSQDYEAAALWKGDSLQIALASLGKPDEFTELVVGRKASGKADGWVNRAAPGAGISVGALPPGIKMAIDRAESTTRYDVLLPWKVVAGSDKPAADPFLLSFLVNDNDGVGRKQWMQLSGGIGDKKDPSQFPSFFIRDP